MLQKMNRHFVVTKKHTKMKINQKSLLLIVCFLGLFGSFALAQEVDLKAVITGNLTELKRLIVIEEAFTQAANDQLAKINNDLVEENARLKKNGKRPANAKEKIVYRIDPSSQKRIAELEQKVEELNKLLKGYSSAGVNIADPNASIKTSVKPQKIDVLIQGVTAAKAGVAVKDKAAAVGTPERLPVPQDASLQSNQPRKMQNNGFIYRKVN